MAKIRTRRDVIGAAAVLGLAAGVWRPQGALAYVPPTDTLCQGLPNSCEDWDAIARQIDTEILPIPDGNPPPLQSVLRAGADGVSEFRTPYPPVPVWNPPGPKRIGIQAGHWNYADSPDELYNNRQNPGTSGGGKAEWQVNLDVAQRTVPLLEAQGYVVDLLDGTPPIRYRAHTFVAIHADGDLTQQLRGYKVGSPIFSATPAADQILVDSLWDEYGAVTGLLRQPNQVSRRMTGYYAFNSKRYQHAIAPGVPQAIIEMAFLTNPQDRAFLFNSPDKCAQGIANGIVRFISAMNI